MNNDGLIVVAVDDEAPRWRNSRIFSTAPPASRKSGLLAPPPRRWSCCRPTTWTRCSWTSECRDGRVGAGPHHRPFHRTAPVVLSPPTTPTPWTPSTSRPWTICLPIPRATAGTSRGPGSAPVGGRGARRAGARRRGATDETIAVELGGVTRYVKRSDIVYVEAQRDYVRLHAHRRASGRVPLANLEERWAPAGFPACASPLPRQRRLRRGPAHGGGRLTVDLGRSSPCRVGAHPAVKAALVEPATGA